MALVLSIDAGTTGVRALLVDERGAVRAHAYREFAQRFPRPGWVEHDPEDWWRATEDSARDALATAGASARDLASLGITNQRETTVLWDRATLRPVHPAIVWQDRRTSGRCRQLREAGHEGLVRERTGLVLDPYFSGTKLAWLLANVEGAAGAAAAGRLAFGTVDAYLVARMTGGRVHATDRTNASRTLLFDIRRMAWDADLLALLGVPAAVLPEVVPSAHVVGTTDPDAFLGAAVPIAGIAGDQQASLFGQACFAPGDAKSTYGTGAFVLLHTGAEAPASSHGLLTTVACSAGAEPAYALEGSVFVAGAAIQWLRDGLGLIARADEAGPLAASVPDAGGVFFVPALTGLGAPWWDPHARGTIVGLTRGTTRAHIVRAAVEAIAHQTRDVVDAMRADAALPISVLRADGGASAMDLLLQLQADLLGTPVERSAVADTTAMGAAHLAGLATGIWGSTGELATLWASDRRFEPGDVATAGARHAAWRRAVERALGWADEDAGTDEDVG